jgi:hypothetical protein
MAMFEKREDPTHSRAQSDDSLTKDQRDMWEFIDALRIDMGLNPKEDLKHF